MPISVKILVVVNYHLIGFTNINGFRGISMIRIAVCDDNHKECFDLEEMLRETAKEKSWKIKTHGYSNGKELYEAITNEGMSFDIILLDIEMGDMDGIDFSRKLRKQLRDKLTKIIFISWEKKYAMDLFSLRAHDFLAKPIDKKKLSDSLFDAVEMLEISNKEINYFYYKIGYDSFQIDTREILYFSIGEKKVIMKTRSKGEIKFSGKIREVYEKLKECGFFFSHKSYLVNYRNIESMRNTGIIMVNGEKIPVSRAHKSEINEMLLIGRGKSRKDEFRI